MTSIIIVNYQKYEDTLACVDSILKSKTTEDYRIVIIDNASPNDSWERLQTFNSNSKVVTIQAKENNGYCAGNNIGIKYSLENIKPDYIWILNPDTLVKDDCLEKLHRFAVQQNDLGILGCKLVYYPDTQYLQALGGGNFRLSKFGELRPEEHLYHLQPSNEQLPEVMTMDLIIGASMYIPSYVFDKVGLMNENFFLYSDENEFCLRVLNVGLKNYAISSATVFHKEGIRQKNQSLMASYYSCRNKLYLVKDLYPQNLKRNIQIYFYRTILRFCKLKFREGLYRIRAFRDFKKNIVGKVSL
ncbi:MAG: glycosyltransferase family 2 protein [Bacteroidales bacterium]|nr:glycosyltransferase family 2 protein [Bacteroidales bacterium]